MNFYLFFYICCLIYEHMTNSIFPFRFNTINMIGCFTSKPETGKKKTINFSSERRGKQRQIYNTYLISVFDLKYNFVSSKKNPLFGSIKCALTQLSFGLKQWESALQEPGSRLEPKFIHAQCPALQACHAPQVAAREHSPRLRLSHAMKIPLISIKVLHRIWREWLCSCFTFNKNKDVNSSGNFVPLLLHLNRLKSFICSQSDLQLIN